MTRHFFGTDHDAEVKRRQSTNYLTIEIFKSFLFVTDSLLTTSHFFTESHSLFLYRQVTRNVIKYIKATDI
jgi:hypothetical protein